MTETKRKIDRERKQQTEWKKESLYTHILTNFITIIAGCECVCAQISLVQEVQELQEVEVEVVELGEVEEEGQALLRNLKKQSYIKSQTVRHLPSVLYYLHNLTSLFDLVCTT